MPDASLAKRILALAIPSLGALIAEPLFLLTDTAMVGHLGASALASLGLASTVLTTVIGLLIFLAYATTPIVARRLGAGNRPGALSAGIDGLWLALGLGVILGALGYALTPLVVGWFGAEGDVSLGAVSYLSISWWGLPGMLLVIAATGLMRGLQDTRTPLWIALAGFSANAALNAVLIYGLGLGLIGSALGTVFAQWAMAAVFLAIIIREARAHQVSLAPGLIGIRAAARSGSWLFVRTLSLRVALISTVVVATGLGTRELAAWHIVFTIFSLLALALDALAIAAQALVGHDLGSGDVQTVRQTTSTLMAWGFMGGGMLATLTGLLSPVLPFVMTSDGPLREVLVVVLILLALTLPLSGFVFVLDGVLIGAGDGKYLALTGVLNVVMFAPFLWLASITQWEVSGVNLGGLLMLETAFGVSYIGARALTLGLRARGERWMVTGESR
ncbi:MAG: MATE family efflux transporter [Pontimonas sp.]|nr:MATE family efflux transporter [Pontimonas sp.]MDP5128593.1 MATE family efflux transporter [Pontimonas sp.]